MFGFLVKFLFVKFNLILQKRRKREREREKQANEVVADTLPPPQPSTRHLRILDLC